MASTIIGKITLSQEPFMKVHNQFLNLTSILILLTILIQACSLQPKGNQGLEPYPAITLDIKKMNSCEEFKKIHSQIEEKKSYYSRKYRQNRVYSVAMSGSAETSNAVQTNVQEASVDEADYVKQSDDQLFVSRYGGIEVLDKNTLESYGELNLPKSMRANLYTYKDYLIAFAATQNLDQSYWQGYTEVNIYRLQRNNIPILQETKLFDGQYSQVRRDKNDIYFVINHSQYSYSHEISQLDTDIFGISCNDIYHKNILDASLSITQVLKLDILNGQHQSVGVLGNADHIYMVDQNLYLINNSPRSFSGYGFSSNNEDYIVKKIDVGNNMQVTGVGRGYGYIKDSWALKEIDDSLVVASTSRSGSGLRDLSNHLLVFRENGHNLLEIQGAYKNFGLTEDIRAARYFDRKAYVVTFKKTDPLFIFDLKDLSSPQLLGELKVPGFSTYLHPIGKGQLVGVGFDAEDAGDFAWFQGIQVSLFDVSDSSNPQRSDVKIHGERGSSSLVNSDHHAFFYSEKESILALPVLELDKNGNKVFSGAAIYSLDQGSLNLKAEITHIEFLESPCESGAWWRWWTYNSQTPDIERVYIIDHNLVSFSQLGVVSYNLDSLEVTNEHKFSRQVDICSNHQNHWM